MVTEEEYKKWQEAMEKGKDYLIEKHLDTVEGYLEDVVNRLFDVSRALEALEGTSNMEKINLIRHGQSFAYQQAVLDVVNELFKYAAGERNLDEDIKEMLSTLAEETAGGIQFTEKQKEQLGMFQ